MSEAELVEENHAEDSQACEEFAQVIHVPPIHYDGAEGEADVDYEGTVYCGKILSPFR